MEKIIPDAETLRKKAGRYHVDPLVYIIREEINSSELSILDIAKASNLRPRQIEPFVSGNPPKYVVCKVVTLILRALGYDADYIGELFMRAYCEEEVNMSGFTLKPPPVVTYEQLGFKKKEETHLQSLK